LKFGFESAANVMSRHRCSGSLREVYTLRARKLRL
jgi:hypothetical protein